ncbi:MAG: hypothetical protein ACM3RP_13890 [Chitinophagales bacterium]
MQVRVFEGFLAGFIAGVPMNLWGFLSKRVFHFASRIIFDYESFLIFGHAAKGAVETLVALVTHMLWAGILGIVYAYLVPFSDDERPLFRGWIFSIVVWLLLLKAGTTFKIPGIYYVPWRDAVSNFVAATLWGLTLGGTFTWLLHRRRLAEGQE